MAKRKPETHRGTVSTEFDPKPNFPEPGDRVIMPEHSVKNGYVAYARIWSINYSTKMAKLEGTGTFTCEDTDANHPLAVFHYVQDNLWIYLTREEPVPIAADKSTPDVKKGDKVLCIDSFGDRFNFQESVWTVVDVVNRFCVDLERESPRGLRIPKLVDLRCRNIMRDESLGMWVLSTPQPPPKE